MPNEKHEPTLPPYPTYRFPKWLYAETYQIAHDAHAPGQFVVTVIRGQQRLVGFGATITQAAKRAMQNQRSGRATRMPVSLR